MCVINELVKQINKSLENDCYMTALTTALILPDACGKAAYSDIKSSRERYIKWYDEYIGKYEKNPDSSEEMPYLSGNVVWELRCSLLHECNPNVSKEKNDIDCFELLWQGTKSCSFSMSSSMVQTSADGEVLSKEISINILRICKIICDVAKEYYRNNKELFNFFNYKIYNTDKMARKVFGIRDASVI